MNNEDIATTLRNISALMQIKGEDAFRARMYERAADAIDDSVGELSELVSANQLRSLPGIGKSMEAHIIELFNTGSSQLYEELVAETGEAVLDLLKIRGVGAKTAARLYQELGIRDLRALRAAIDEGKLKTMPRMGGKTIANINEGLRFVESQQKLRPLWQILGVADELSEKFRESPHIHRFDFTGDFRRHEEVLESLALVVETDDTEALCATLGQVSKVTAPRKGGEQKVVAEIEEVFPLCVHLSSAEAYEATLLTTTCSSAHLATLNQAAVSKGLEPIDLPPPRWTNGKAESALYSQLNLPFIVPELRNDSDAIEAALAGALPDLITRDALRSDLHMHTNWSDGRNTVREMAEAAKTLGHEYIAITDHSQASQVANGLTPERLLEQIQHVREINAQIEGIEILVGAEVDIRKDGRLDYEDDILAQLDIVVASVHQAFSLSESEMTARVIRAIENPFVTIIGHPTGRLLGRRPGYAINLDAIAEAASERRVALEINASLSRLDLGAPAVKEARQAGVLFSINTDAHATVQLGQSGFGVDVARRGWLGPENVINTYTLAELRQLKG